MSGESAERAERGESGARRAERGEQSGGAIPLSSPNRRLELDFSFSSHGGLPSESDESARVEEDGLSPLLCFAVRAVVISHFVCELLDKITNWSSWVSIVGEAGFSLPTSELALATCLLAWSVMLVLLGRDLVLAAVLLTIYQVPTSLFFESGWYEWSDSASAVGGVLALALLAASRTGHASSRVALAARTLREERVEREAGRRVPASLPTLAAERVERERVEREAGRRVPTLAALPAVLSAPHADAPPHPPGQALASAGGAAAKAGELPGSTVARRIHQATGSRTSPPRTISSSVSGVSSRDIRSTASRVSASSTGAAGGGGGAAGSNRAIPVRLPSGSNVVPGKHGRSTEQVPVSAYGGSSKNEDSRRARPSPGARSPGRESAKSQLTDPLLS